MGAAEPRYVLQSPGLVENCVGLYVPLLEFNHRRIKFDSLMKGPLSLFDFLPIVNEALKNRLKQSAQCSQIGDSKCLVVDDLTKHLQARDDRKQ